MKYLQPYIRQKKRQASVLINKTYGHWRMKLLGGFKKEQGRSVYQCKHIGQAQIKAALESTQPFMVARYGLYELRAMASVCYGYRGSGVLTDLCHNAGFFPQDSELVPHFADVYSKATKRVDIFAAWLFRHGHWKEEEAVFRDYCADATLTDIAALNFLRSMEPWTQSLRNKVVLVIHPFSSLIERQYERRAQIFPSSNILPDFADLLTIKSVQSAAGAKAPFRTWFDALAHMQSQIDRIDFDVALIGAGAYGLPLAAYVKSQGKQAIHLGGITQMLFGIIGARWENSYRHLINESWVRPKIEDRPPQYEKVENGCYW